MKKAVVFYGSMRNIELGSKFWKYLGEDVDYFVVTWDVVNPHHSDSIEPYPFEISKFPVPVKASIIVNFQSHVMDLTNMGLTDIGMLHVLYHWSLIKNLPGISSYDAIIVTRTDAIFGKPFGIDWEPHIIPGKVIFTGSDKTTNQGVNDWILVTDPMGLESLHELYHQGINTRDFLDANQLGGYKIIHRYLAEKLIDCPDKFTYIDRPIPIGVLVRPGYPKIWETLEAGPLLMYLLVKHWFEYEQSYRVDNYREEQILQLLRANGFIP